MFYDFGRKQGNKLIFTNGFTIIATTNFNTLSD